MLDLDAELLDQGGELVTLGFCPVGPGPLPLELHLEVLDFSATLLGLGLSQVKRYFVSGVYDALVQTVQRRRTAIRRIITILATVALACGLLLTSSGTAQAAPHHHNTLPYPTGCGRNAVVISRQNMAGGTASIVYSRTCGTNWIEWYGSAIYTAKVLRTGDRWVEYEEDYTAWAYSRQAYAPGSTPIAGGINVTSPNGRWQNWNFECQWTCSWRLVHSG